MNQQVPIRRCTVCADVSLPKLYAVVDYRYDGRPRVVSEFVDPALAAAAAQLLRDAGGDATVELIVRDDDGQT